MTVRGGLVRLQIPSLFDMVDLVQVLSDRMGQLAAFDEDAIHWIGVAVRESVINAIKHGNREHRGKLVTIEFAFTPIEAPTELVVKVTDQGEGFEPEEVADPARAREHAQIERPRHLLHAQLHGRRPAAARARRGAWKCAW